MILRRVALGAVLLAGAGLAAGGPARPAAAQNGGAGSSGGGSGTAAGGTSGAGGLSLVDQDDYVGPGQPFHLTVRTGGAAGQARSDYALQISVSSRIHDRTSFALSVQNRRVGFTLASFSNALDELPPDPAGNYSLCISTGRPAPGCLSPAVDTPPGVYPVRVSLVRLSDDALMGEFTTHIISVSAGPAPELLSFSWVQPVGAAGPVRGGGRSLDSRAEAGLAQTARALSARQGMPITVQPDAATLASLVSAPRSGSTAAVADELRRQTAGLEVLGAPFVPVVPYDLVDNNLASELDLQLTAGRRVLGGWLGFRPPQSPFLVTGPLDRPTVAALRQAGADRLVVPAQDVIPSGNLTPTHPVRLDYGPGPDIPTVMEDSSLASHFNAGDQVLAGHQLVADLAQTWWEAPSVAGRGVVVVVPATWVPNQSFVATVAHALMTTPELVDPVPLDDLYQPGGTTATTTGAELSSLSHTRAGSLPVARITAARHNLEALTGALPAGPPASLQSMGAQILASQEAGLSAGQRDAYLGREEAAFSRAVSQVGIAGQREVTLTSRGATIPVTVTSGLGVRLQVRVQFSSDSLSFREVAPSPGVTCQNGNDCLVDMAGPNATIELNVVAKAVNRFPLRAEVTTPDGSLVFQRTSLPIQTAISPVGIFLSVGAAGFLALWWGRTLVRDRRRKRERPA